MKISLNSRTIVFNLIPSFLRGTKFVNFLYSLTNGLEYCNTNTLEFLKYTSQTIYIEKYLNDLYDNILRRISIENNIKLQTYLFRRSELSTQNTYLFRRSEISSNPNFQPTFIKQRSESTSSDYNYFVYVPSALIAQGSAINQTLNLLNPADKTFNIILI